LGIGSDFGKFFLICCYILLEADFESIVKLPTRVVIDDVENHRVVDFDLGEFVSVFLTSNRNFCSF